MAKLIMGYWDCPNCNNAVKGTLRTCPHCGNARGQGVTFYTKELEYLSEEEAAKIGAEPDWLCEYCGTYNNAKNTHCVGCGAVRGSENQDYFDINKDKDRRHEKDSSVWDCAYCGAQNPADADHCQNCKAERCEKPKEEKKPETKKKKPVWPFFLLFAAILILGIIIARNSKKTVEATVTNIAYESFVHYEDYGPHEHVTSDRSEIPAGAEIVRTEEKQENAVVTEMIVTQTDNGNGTFTEEEISVTKVLKQPVTYYTYSVLEWAEVNKPATLVGGGKVLDFADVAETETRRISKKTVKYSVTLKLSDGTEVTRFIFDKDKDLVNKIEVGNTYKFTIKNNESIIKVE